MNAKFYSTLLLITFISGWVVLSEGFTFTVTDPPKSAPCQQALTYQLGDIDSRFDVSEQELIEVLKEVETLWSSALGRNVLNFSESGNVSVNLIYSKEQQLTDAERQFSNRIKAKEQQEETARRVFDQLSKRYKEKEQEVRQTLSTYNKTASTYDDLANKWDGKEANTEIIDKFNKLEQQLKNIDEDLKQEKQNLASLRERTNAKTEQLNTLIKEHNNLIEEYNNRFSKPRKFDQGQYVKRGENQAVNIYQFGSRAQLKTVLAHEMGHALGLDHVDNPKSIMHKMMDAQNMANLQLTEEDISVLKKQCNM
ncbi:matrixin family metalloprotease [Aliifodinibius salipaludis]|uniref:matrixin family metalloprotease n=1 Tax=Fodinibius salipaludis TaxID=2032627 RepID=UPI0015952B3A|nr:matrixin family metalloprotease [Aliifodinibius salipaludis]